MFTALLVMLAGLYSCWAVMMRSAPPGLPRRRRLCSLYALCPLTARSQLLLAAESLWTPFSKCPFSLVSQGKRGIENGNRQGYLRYSWCRGKYNLRKCRDYFISACNFNENILAPPTYSYGNIFQCNFQPGIINNYVLFNCMYVMFCGGKLWHRKMGALLHVTCHILGVTRKLVFWSSTLAQENVCLAECYLTYSGCCPEM